MKKIYIILMALVAGIAAQGQAKKHYELKIKDFDDLRVDNHIPVDYYCNPDSAGYAVFDATDNQAAALVFDNNGRGKLSVQIDSEYPKGKGTPHIRVYSSTLKSVTNSGDSLVKVNNLPPMDKFKAVLIGNGRLSIPEVMASSVDASLRSGNGQLSLGGRCTDAKLSIIGTGTILADRLEAVKIKASVVGTGSIGCNPSEAITVMGAGSGKVFYRQAPPTIKSRGVGIKHFVME